MKILLVGDIVGSPGRKAFARVAARMKADGHADVIVANAENSAGGNGLTGETAEELFAVGADVLTLGDHAWDQKAMLTYIEREPRIVRPANFAPGCPGRGLHTFDVGGDRVTVIDLVGRVFMQPYDCPFRMVDALLAKDVPRGGVVLVDMHAEATSEKIVMGRYLDGRVSAVFGTHTHVQTSDETILPKGTAYITDLGMTGPKDSAIGRDLDAVTQRFLTGMPKRFGVARDNVVLEGAVLRVDTRSGRVKAIKRVREAVE
jgi:metallophosphoesterase (TIGR00282 family)